MSTGLKRSLGKEFKFLPDIATADIAFEAAGQTPSELFENAGLALENAMVDTESVKPKEVLRVTKEEISLEDLLFSFLEELVFLKDAKGLLFNRLKCEIKRLTANSYKLTAILRGEKIDRKRHKLKVDVKAVTKHMFELKQLPSGTWHCRVILDI